MKAVDHLVKICDCDSIDKLIDSLCLISAEHGFPHVLYGLKTCKTASYDTALIVSNYAPEWRETYDENKLHQVDPTVSHALNRLQPLIWDRSTFNTPLECVLYDDASQFGLKMGITLPIHGAKGEFGLISYVSDHALTRNDMLAAVVQLAWTRDFVFEAILHIMNAAQTFKRSPLTPRETECLKWLAAGKTSWAISKILSCSEATINFHVSNIMKKLGVFSRQHAVVKSIREGWIAFE